MEPLQITDERACPMLLQRQLLTHPPTLDSRDRACDRRVAAGQGVSDAMAARSISYRRCVSDAHMASTTSTDWVLRIPLQAEH